MLNDKQKKAYRDFMKHGDFHAPYYMMRDYDIGSPIVANWLSYMHDLCPRPIRKSVAWKNAVKLAFTTKEGNELERAKIVGNWIFDDVLPKVNPQDSDLKAAWIRMLEERTLDATFDCMELCRKHKPMKRLHYITNSTYNILCAIRDHENAYGSGLVYYNLIGMDIAIVVTQSIDKSWMSCRMAWTFLDLPGTLRKLCKQ